MITKFDIGDKLYALNYFNNSKENIAISIEIVEIIGIHIYKDTIDYVVKTILTNEEWGDTVEESYLSKDINDLINELKI